MKDCPDCGVRPGQSHKAGCGEELCSVDGFQHRWCKCIGHEPEKRRWLGAEPQGQGRRQ